jgi:prepilin-type processing-associated H-X9-DG protein
MFLGVFLRDREKGRRATCQSNLRQIGLAAQTYVQDYEGKLPIMTGDISWAKTLDNYIKNKGILFCPSQKRPDVAIFKDSNYFYNFDRTLTYGRTPAQRRSGIEESTISRPSDFIFFGDSADSRYFVSRQATIPTGCPFKDVGFAGSILHNGGGNYVFYDGHVKWLLPEGRAAAECDAGLYGPFVRRSS